MLEIADSMFNSAYWVILHLFWSSPELKKQTNLNPDQAGHFVGPDLGPDFLHLLLLIQEMCKI